jgi:hypothetical protein
LKLLLAIFLLVSFVEAKEKIPKRVVVSKVGKEKFRIRSYLNRENPYNRASVFVAEDSKFLNTVAIPDRFKVTDMRVHVKYLSGIAINDKASLFSVVANNKFVKQDKLYGGKTSSVTTEVPISFLREGYNNLDLSIYQVPKSEFKGAGSKAPPKKMKMDQTGKKFMQCVTVGEFSSGTSQESVPDIWTQINTHDSYIEYDFTLKPFEEKISSIYKFMFDNKNLIVDRVNFVFPAFPTEEDFNNYGLLANIIGNIMQFQDVKFSVSTKIVDKRNNVLVMSKEKAREILKEYRVENKLDGDINIIQNPKNGSKGILVITGNIKNSLYRLTNSDIRYIESQSIVVGEVELPDKSLPYSLENFFLNGERIEFKDMGYVTQNFPGAFIYTIELKFKTYPKNRFDSDDPFKVVMNYTNANPSKLVPTFNIYTNSIFNGQIRGVPNPNYENSTDYGMDTLSKELSPYLLEKGENVLNIESVLYPVSEKICGTVNIRMAIQDDSYVVLPTGSNEIEYPNLKYLDDYNFPFSIYPDLQDTGIVITDFNAETIASAMGIAFQLGKRMKSLGLNLTTTYDMNKVLEKNIIVVGKQIEAYKPLYAEAPVHISDSGFTKNIFDEDRNKTISFDEVGKFENMVVAQTYQSPFNPDKIVFEVTAKKPRTLLKGVEEGFTKNLGEFDGDVWFYDIQSEESHSFRYKDTYFISEVKQYENDFYQDIEEF